MKIIVNSGKCTKIVLSVSSFGYIDFTLFKINTETGKEKLIFETDVESIDLLKGVEGVIEYQKVKYPEQG